MSAPDPSSERVGEALVATLLQDALKEVAVAFGRANKTAALFTLAAVERDLVSRAEAFPDLLAAPRVTRDTTDRVIARISIVLADVQRLVEGMSIQ
jgi:hypothetical protein